MKILLRILGILLWLPATGCIIRSCETRHLIPGFQGYLVARSYREIPDLYMGIIFFLVGYFFFSVATYFDKDQEEKQIDIPIMSDEEE